MLCEDIYVGPVVACAGGSEYFAGWGEMGDEVLIPAAHFTAGIPEGAEDGVEVAPCLGFEVLDEGGSLAF